MSWQYFVILNLATASLLVPLQRLLLRRHEVDPVTFIVISQLVTGMLLLPVNVLYGFQLPDFGRLGWHIIAMFILYSVGHYLYATTLKQVEASVFSTLLNTSTVWVVLMGYIVLQETVQIREVVGTVLIMASVLMLMEHKKRKLHLEKSVFMGLLVGLIFGVALALWVYIGRQSDLLTWTTLSFFGTPLIMLLVRPATVVSARQFLVGNIPARMAVLAVIWAIDNLASLAAYQRGDVSVIAPLLQTSAVFSVIIAIIFLNERSRLGWKIAASSLCCVGAVFIIS